MSEVALLQLLAEDPDDLATLAVLADLYADRGDPRGELIQLELAPPSADNTARKKALHKQHDAAWLAPFARIAPDLRFGFVRGLVGAVAGPADVLAIHQRTIATRAALVHRLTLAPARDLTPWRGSPLLARARALTIQGGARRVAAWDALGPLPHLRELVLDAVALGADDVASIVAAAPTLTRLVISAGRLNKGAEMPLAGLAHLRELDMPAYHLGPSFGQLLGAFTQLRALAIAGSDLTDDGLRALLPALATVETLDVRGSVSGAVIPALLAALPVVRELEIGTASTPSWGDAACALLAGWAGATRLTRLHLGDAGITDVGARALAGAPNLANLTSLVLSGARLTDDAKAILVCSPHLAAARIYAGDRQLARPPAPTSRASPTASPDGRPSTRTNGPRRTARRTAG
ncbi:MAG: hypothetical protein NT062_05055 [Proteobacteria bacterium]|nr:hypothetical protein [Pseudomonadota bacterium]